VEDAGKVRREVVCVAEVCVCVCVCVCMCVRLCWKVALCLLQSIHSWWRLGCRRDEWPCTSLCMLLLRWHACFNLTVLLFSSAAAALTAPLRMACTCCAGWTLGRLTWLLRSSSAPASSPRWHQSRHPVQQRQQHLVRGLACLCRGSPPAHLLGSTAAVQPPTRDCSTAALRSTSRGSTAMAPRCSTADKPSPLQTPLRPPSSCAHPRPAMAPPLRRRRRPPLCLACGLSWCPPVSDQLIHQLLSARST
jgi:hypothetical protein